jgi:hypothetical protein
VDLMVAAYGPNGRADRPAELEARR